MKRTILIILATLMLSHQAAQAATTMRARSASEPAQANSILDKINAIKADNEKYFWSEYTHYTADTAIVNGSKWMLDEINAYRQKPLSIDQLLPIVKHIKINRGKLVRAFVYVEKQQVLNMPPSHPETTTTAVPDVPDSTSTVASNGAARITTPEYPDELAKEIMRQKNFFKVYDFLGLRKKEGQLLQYGPLKDVDEDDYHALCLVVFDITSQEVLTVLSAAAADGKRTNLVSGIEDALENYPEDMIAVIWYLK